jgi:hypothetical protein
MRVLASKDLAGLRAQARERIDRAFMTLRFDLNADIHAAKLAEARLIQSGGPRVSTPLLDVEAQSRGEGREAVAATVIAKASAAADSVALMEVDRQAAHASLDAAATAAAIAQIERWTLDALKVALGKRSPQASNVRIHRDGAR